MNWVKDVYWEIWAKWHCAEAPRFWFCSCKADEDFDGEE